MFIYHRNVSVSIVVAIIRKRNSDALTNNIYSFFLKYIRTDTQTDRQTDTHSLLCIRLFLATKDMWEWRIVCGRLGVGDD
jgi:hypothetical protein